MTTITRDAPALVGPTLIPALPQQLWKTPAVANFFFGGLGAGFYLVAAVAASAGAAPALTLASWLGPLLVAAGFAAVAFEAGRPFRGARVIARGRTSWMSRELLLGGAFIVLAAAELVTPAAALRVLAVITAVAFILAQGFILRRARGVIAWNVPIVPGVFLASAVTSGLGLYLFVESVADRTPSAGVFRIVLSLLVVSLVVWLRYLFSTKDARFVAATAALRSGDAAIELVAIGYVTPFVASALAIAMPTLAPTLAGVTGASLVAGQARVKWALLREAGFLRPITMSHLTFPHPSGASTHPDGARTHREGASARPWRSS